MHIFYFFLILIQECKILCQEERPLKTTYFCSADLMCSKWINMCCFYKDFGRICGRPVVLTMTKFDRQLVLDTYNKLRNEIAGGTNTIRPDLKGITAANMRVLSYSRELEYTASCWAKQCTFGTSRCRKIREGNIGEIVCGDETPRNQTEEGLVELGRAILTWCPTYSLAHFSGKFTEELIDRLKLPLSEHDMENTHSIQVIWAETAYIGCYKLMYAHQNPILRRLHLVCHFFPEGYLEPEPIFLRGKPCTRCKQGQACNAEYPNLCGDIRPLEQDRWSPPAAANNISCNKFLTLIIMFKMLNFF